MQAFRKRMAGRLQKLRREWNKELKSEGYFTKAGSIPRAYFEKKCYGFAEAE